MNYSAFVFSPFLNFLPYYTTYFNDVNTYMVSFSKNRMRQLMKYMYKMRLLHADPVL